MTLRTESWFIAAVVLATGISTPLQAEIYRSVDDNGNVTFTDKKPVSGDSEIVELKTFTTTPTPPKTSVAPQPVQPKTPKSAYTKIGFLKPENGEYFHSPETLEIEVESKPALNKGDKYRFLFDGKTAGIGTEPKFSIQWPDRGTHVVQVQIVNQRKKVVLETDKRTIFIMRPIKKNRLGTPRAQPLTE